MPTIADELNIRSAINNFPDGFCLLKPVFDENRSVTDFIFEFVNKEAGRILNQEPKQLEGCNFLSDAVCMETKLTWFSLLQTVIKTGQPFSRKKTFQIAGTRHSVLIRIYETDGLLAVSLKDSLITGISRQIRKQYQKYLDLSGILFTVLNDDGSIEIINNYGASLLGYRPEALIGKNWFNVFVPKKDKKKIKRIFSLVLSGKIEPGFCFQNQLIAADGRKILFSFNNTVLKDRSGHTKALISVAEDITESRQQTEKLKEQARLLQSTYDAFMVHDYSSRIIFWNKGAERMYGWTEEEALGKTAYDLLHTKSPVKVEEIFEMVKRDKIWRGELIHQAKNGEIRIVDSRWELLDKNYILEVTRDITESKKAADLIRQERELLDKLINRIPVMITMYDPKVNVLSINRELTKLTGWTEDDARDNDLMKLCYPDENQRRQVQEFMESVDDNWKDLEMTTKDGGLLETSWTNIKLTNDTRVGIGIDITYRKELERKKDEFMNIASHELKTPLTTIKAYSQLLAKTAGGGSRQLSADYLNRMGFQVQKLEDLINELLDISRIREGKLTLNQENIRIDELIKNTVGDIDMISTGHRINIKNNARAVVFADRFRLSQVIINLLNNAVKYSPPGSEILVNSEKKSGQFVVSVQDHGVGIEEGKLPYIFDQFYQANNPIKTKTGQPGLGLGLYISAEIIRRHSGKIWVESRKGQGTTFYFSLPLVED